MITPPHTEILLDYINISVIKAYGFNLLTDLLVNKFNCCNTLTQYYNQAGNKNAKKNKARIYTHTQSNEPTG